VIERRTVERVSRTTFANSTTSPPPDLPVDSSGLRARGTRASISCTMDRACDPLSNARCGFSSARQRSRSQEVASTDKEAKRAPTCAATATQQGPMVGWTPANARAHRTTTAWARHLGRIASLAVAAVARACPIQIRADRGRSAIRPTAARRVVRPTVIARAVTAARATADRPADAATR